MSQRLAVANLYIAREPQAFSLGDATDGLLARGKRGWLAGRIRNLSQQHQSVRLVIMQEMLADRLDAQMLRILTKTFDEGK